jgi:cellulose synthase/poly-beta-1,6-N-acetylglucosamine synthase-like glycosyltransferase
MIAFYAATIWLFWLCVAGVAYSYLLYPAFLYLAARLFGRSDAPPPLCPDADLPRLSLLVAAHNEETVIEGRVRNALELDYPREKLEIVIASDGSEDRTSEIVRRYADRGVRLLDFPNRRGKATVLNDAMGQLGGQIVLLSDANTDTDPDAARKLVRWFADPAIGAVCGRLVLTDPASGKNVDSLYWRYETFLKRQESRLGALLGSNGAIYAIRRELLQPIPNATIIDDFVIPLLAKQRSGCRLIYECAAVAREESAPDIATEFRRRSRIGAGGWQAIGMLWRLLNPMRGWIAFTFFSHKILRWLCPFFLLLMVVTSAAIWSRPLYRFLLVAQAAFYLAALLGRHVPRGVPLAKLLRLANMFASMNAALLVGFFRWLSGPQTGIWRPTRRAA